MKAPDTLLAHWRKGALVLSLAAAAAAGRGCRPPPRVETRTEWKERIEWKERVVERVRVETVEREAEVRVVERVRIVRPDGTQETRERAVETRETARETAAEHKAERESAGQTEASGREFVRVEPYRAQWQVSAVGGLAAPSADWRAGALLQRRVAGPVWAGALIWGGPGGGAAGVTLGLEW